ncbi:MAG: tail fiber domain-containing protein, partial [Candidatus Acidiferrales bacterium]
AGRGSITHDCPPGAVQVDGFVGNFSGVAPAVLPIKIVAAREGVSISRGGVPAGGGGGGGGVESVTAGDASITIGGTVANPTVAVADGGVTPAKLSFAAGTVTEVSSGDGLTGGPITTTGTLSVDFGGPGAATTPARSDHTHEVAPFGQGNTGVGPNALAGNGGSGNTAVGFNALGNTGNTNTSDNIAIGHLAGVAVMTGSNTILVGNQGTSSESDTIRIGIPSGGAAHTATFIGGICGVTTGVADAIAVMIDSNGQLGTVSSTRRVKEDINAMGEASAGLLRLRPVVFRFRQPMADGSKPLQYGLIAEEVAEVMPELVVYNAEGQPQTVQYHVLPALLLNEIQRQQAQVNRQEEELAALRQMLAAQEAELAELKAVLR